MKGVVGFTKLSPLTFNNAIRPYVFGRGWLTVSFDKNKNYSDKNKSYVFLFMSMAEFLQFVGKVKRRKMVCVIFDCEERLKELEGITIPDLKKVDIPAIKLTLKQIFKAKLKFQIKTRRRNVIKEITEKNKQEGFLHIYNTIFYSITSKEIRETVKTNIVLYLNGFQDAKPMVDALTAKMPKRGKAKEAVENFILMTQSDEVEKLRKALKLVHKTRGKITVEDAAKMHNAQTFDMRYMLASLEKLREEGKVK